MGKIPPSLRAAVFPVNRLLNKNPQSIAAGDQQRPDLVTKSKEPHHFLEKTPKKKDSPKSITNTTRRNHSRRSPIITFSSPDISAAKSIIDSIKTTTHSDCRFYNSLLESFIATSPTLDDSTSLLRHMVKRHPIFCPDRSTYHILLSHSCKSSDPDPLSSVRKTLSLMDSEGFPPDKGTIDVAIRSLCSAHCLDHAVKLVNEYCVKDLPPDSFTYNYLLKCLCKDRDLGAVNSFITEMRESFSIKPDLFAYTILIDNVCNKKNLREAARLLELLAEDGIQPDVYVYNTIMKGHCMLGQGVEVVRVFKRMIEQGVEPDLVTYNTLIFGLSKSGRVKEAKKYLDVITDTCHFPDAVTYTSLMNGMCRKGDALGALQLLGEMEEKGCTPNSCTYNTLLHGLCKAKLLVKAVEFFGAMREAGMKLESGSYGQLLRLLCRSGKVSEAYEVFDYAVESKSLKDVFAYSTLESTLKWLKKAREQGLAV